MFKSVLVILLIFNANCSLIDAIASVENNASSARRIGESLGECFGENETVKCFENIICKILDKTIASNETWQLNEYLLLEKVAKNDKYISSFDELQNLTTERAQQVSLSDTLAFKILQLLQTRSLRIQLPSSTVSKLFNKRRISTALKDSNADTDVMETELFDAVGRALPQEEGRKKKDKDKNMAMMGGMAMMAMVAQMFLGKVILIAGAAFVMAKVALLISALGSLKKGTSGSAAGTEHVIVTGSGASGGHSHEHISSWHRRIPYEQHNYQLSDNYKLIEPINYGEVNDNVKNKRRNPYQKAPIKNT